VLCAVLCLKPAANSTLTRYFPQHKSLRTSPAQAAGVTDELLDMTHLCAVMDTAIPAKKRGPYKKKQ
jgi:hypothetical protein